MLILIRRSTCMRSYLHLYILVTYLKHKGMPPPDYRYFLFPLFYFLSVSFFYFSIPVSTLFLLLKRFSHLWLCVQANLAGEPLREAAVSSSCVYSLLAGTDPDILVAAGASNRIDVLSHSLQHSYATLHFPL